jgi:hypothetical protein
MKVWQLPLQSATGAMKVGAQGLLLAEQPGSYEAFCGRFASCCCSQGLMADTSPGGQHFHCASDSQDDACGGFTPYFDVAGVCSSPTTGALQDDGVQRSNAAVMRQVYTVLLSYGKVVKQYLPAHNQAGFAFFKNNLHAAGCRSADKLPAS